MSKKVWDVLIVGAGPSALTAAIYTARENLSTVLLERGVVGGLTATIDDIANFPGYPDGVTGLELSNAMEAQAAKFGAVIEYAEATKITRQVDEMFRVDTDEEPFYARTILLATGNSYRHVGVPGEDEFAHYCATCDGAFYRDKSLAVIGGGNTAVQESLFLTRFATHINLLARSHVKASAVLQQDLAQMVKSGKITVHEGVIPDEMRAGKLLAHDTKSGQKREFDDDGIFVFVGVIPNTEFLRADSNVKVELDGVGHIKTSNQMVTSEPGIFASGDVRAGANEQIVSATGEGATAALNIREFLIKVDRQHEPSKN